MAAPELDYDKLLKLFNSPHSAELYDRHVAVVERVCRVNSKGFVSSPTRVSHRALHAPPSLARSPQWISHTHTFPPTPGVRLLQAVAVVRSNLDPHA